MHTASEENCDRKIKIYEERPEVPGFPSGRLAQDCGATGADDDRLRVTKHGRDLVASGALDVHEVRVGTLHQTLQLAFPTLLFNRRMQKIFGERHSYKFF